MVLHLHTRALFMPIGGAKRGALARHWAGIGKAKRINDTIEISSVLIDTQVHNNPSGSLRSEPGNGTDREAV